MNTPSRRLGMLISRGGVVNAEFGQPLSFTLSYFIFEFSPIRSITVLKGLHVQAKPI